VTLISTILAGSVGADDALVDDCRATIDDGDDNLVQTPDGCARPAGDALSGDPLLGPLADNGGPTLTLALRPDSPAVDGGADPLALANDQRGLPRTTFGGRTDVGAFELSVPLTLQLDAPDGGDFDLQVAATSVPLEDGGATLSVVPERPLGLAVVGAGSAALADYDVTIDCGGEQVSGTTIALTPTAATSCTVTATLKPSPTPTASPTATPTASPTATATPAPTATPAIAPTLKLELTTGRAQLLTDRRSVSALVGCGPVACSVRLTGTIKLPGSPRTWKLTSATRSLAAGSVVRLRLPSSLALRRAVRAARKRHPGRAIALTVALSARASGATTTVTRRTRLRTRALQRR